MDKAPGRYESILPGMLGVLAVAVTAGVSGGAFVLLIAWLSLRS